MRRISRMSAPPFSSFEEFSNASKPVVLVGAMGSWPAMAWNLSSIEQQCGMRPLAGTCVLGGDPQTTFAGVQRIGSNQDLQASDLVDQGLHTLADLIQAQGAGAPFHLHGASIEQLCPDLLLALRVPSYFPIDMTQQTSAQWARMFGLDACASARHHPHAVGASSHPALFISPTGVQSPLHTASQAARTWMGVLRGTMRIRMFSPKDAPHLRPSVCAQHDVRYCRWPAFDAFNLARHALQDGAVVWETRLSPGDILFLPQGWPRQARSMEDTIAVSYDFVDRFSFAGHLTWLVGAIEAEDGHLNNAVRNSGRNWRMLLASYVHDHRAERFPTLTLEDGQREETDWPSFFRNNQPEHQRLFSRTALLEEIATHQADTSFSLKQMLQVHGERAWKQRQKRLAEMRKVAAAQSKAASEQEGKLRMRSVGNIARAHRLAMARLVDSASSHMDRQHEAGREKLNAATSVLAPGEVGGATMTQAYDSLATPASEDDAESIAIASLTAPVIEGIVSNYSAYCAWGCPPQVCQPGELLTRMPHPPQRCSGMPCSQVRWALGNMMLYYGRLDEGIEHLRSLTREDASEDIDFRYRVRERLAISLLSAGRAGQARAHLLTELEDAKDPANRFAAASLMRTIERSLSQYGHPIPKSPGLARVELAYAAYVQEPIPEHYVGWGASHEASVRAGATLRDAITLLDQMPLPSEFIRFMQRREPFKLSTVGALGHDRSLASLGIDASAFTPERLRAVAGEEMLYVEAVRLGPNSRPGVFGLEDELHRYFICSFSSVLADVFPLVPGGTELSCLEQRTTAPGSASYNASEWQLYLNQNGRLPGALYVRPLDKMPSAASVPHFLHQSKVEMDRAMLWMGRGDVRSSLHFDNTENVYILVRGRKQFRLFPPSYARRLRPTRPVTYVSPSGEIGAFGSPRPVGMFSEFVRTDLEEGPMAEHAHDVREHAYTVELVAGEALYLPRGWWHEVISDGGAETEGEQEDAHLAVSFWFRTPEDADQRVVEPQGTQDLDVPQVATEG